jgi:putative flippase GtrA
MIGRVVRCFAVSLGTTVLSAVVLIALAVGLGVPAGIANVVAVGCGIGPSYVGNRQWVWKRTDRSSYRREVIPFWTLAIAGLITSTIAVAWIGSETAAWSPAARSVALPIANLATFAALWVVQFVVLDRVIFREQRSPAGALG